MGHPVLGDWLYAPREIEERAGRLCLHAKSLSFRDPAGGDIHVKCAATWSLDDVRPPAPPTDGAPSGSGADEHRRNSVGPSSNFG
mmetsp:Transcript_10852/g.38357  ORF Transcript_10852/g.38357 Transcript_10852/m.38357 type:complete len:85 (-) Transcript_10852:27-281(-)